MKKIITFIFITLALVGCEKKEEDIHPTETKTTIIEIDKDKSNIDSEKEESEENNTSNENYLKDSNTN